MPSDRNLETTGSWSKSRLSDSAVIALVLSGNGAAYEAIMRRYNRLLFRLARGFVASDEDARDIVQECYVRAYFRLSQFNGPDGFPSWISRIVINEALSRLRKQKLVYDDGVDADDLQASAWSRPEEIAMSQDTRKLLESAIDTLPMNFRVVFMLRGVEELSVNETAELLNIKSATVKTRYHRARTLLKKALSRRIVDAVPTSFTFGGEQCDAIVQSVFAAIAGIPTRRNGE